MSAFTAFIEPLSACFSPRPGQDFTAFAKQLTADLASYSDSILTAAAVRVRREHQFSTWPTIAECLKHVRDEAHAQYVPVDRPPPKAVPKHVSTRAKVEPCGGMLTKAEMNSCPVGTIYSAGDAMIIYPDGTFETWAEFRRRRKEAA